MKILVTGAAGFIGFHLVNRLVSEGHEVIGLDNINNYYNTGLKYDRLLEAGIHKQDIEDKTVVQSRKSSNYKFVLMGLEDREGLLALCKAEKFDKVCNLAAQAGVRYSLENPHSYIQSNIVGFMNLLEVCKENGIKHLVYASSSSVYGMNNKIPFSTEDQVDAPVSIYAATKKSNELMAHAYSHLYGLKTSGLRFFTVYGSWGRPDMAYYLFADAISNKKAIKVFNEGKMMRDFTYIDDVIEGVVKVLEDKPNTEKGKNPYQIYNIGNNAPINLLEFIEELEYQLGMKAERIMLPMQPGDVERTYADVSDLMRDFDFKPQTTIREGVAAFINWYKLYKGDGQG